MTEPEPIVVEIPPPHSGVTGAASYHAYLLPDDPRVHDRAALLAMVYAYIAKHPHDRRPGW